MTVDQFSTLKSGDKVRKVGSKLDRIVRLDMRVDYIKYASHPTGRGQAMGIYAPRVQFDGKKLSGNLHTWEIA